MIVDFVVEILSNWHVGTGAERLDGPDPTDAELLSWPVRVAEDPVPVVPASSLKGLALDHAHLVASTFGLGDEMVEQIFGSPGRQASWYFSSARPLPSEDPPECRVRRYNRVSPATGRVEEDDLFDFEVASPARLATRARSQQPDPPAVETALVVASFAAVERLGARRRRGWGHCRIRAVGSGGEDMTPGFVAPLLGLAKGVGQP